MQLREQALASFFQVLFVLKMNARDLQSMKPVYEQTKAILDGKLQESKCDDEKEQVERQIDDLRARWDAMEESIEKYDDFSAQLVPKVEEYEGTERRLENWLKETENKLHDIPQNAQLTLKERESQIKVTISSWHLLLVEI